MARPKTTLRERVERLVENENQCLIWKGQLRRHRPHLDRFGNPARVLLDLVDQPRIQIRANCPFGNKRCIKPEHWRVVVEQSGYYEGLPPPNWKDPRQNHSEFTNDELEQIEMMVEEVKDDPALIDEVPPNLQEEVLRRVSNL